MHLFRRASKHGGTKIKALIDFIKNPKCIWKKSTNIVKREVVRDVEDFVSVGAFGDGLYKIWAGEPTLTFPNSEC